MATFLEDYLEKIRVLPAQIQRNLDLIRELDEVSFICARRVAEVNRGVSSHGLILSLGCGVWLVQTVLVTMVETKDMQKKYLEKVKETVKTKVTNDGDCGPLCERI